MKLNFVTLFFGDNVKLNCSHTMCTVCIKKSFMASLWLSIAHIPFYLMLFL